MVTDLKAEYDTKREVDLQVTEESWTPEEETRAIRKVDIRLLPYVCLMYIFLNFDRGNISNAAVMNIETPQWTMSKQLNLVGTDFNWAVSVFFFGYCAFEIPSNMLITRFNPSRHMARIMFTWGLCAALQGAAFNAASLMAARFFNGAMEAGFAPGVLLYLAFWYKKFEIGGKFAIIYAGAGLAGSFGGLLSFAIAYMNGAAGLAGWRWLFILEGVATMLVGVGAWWIVPDYPQTCSFLTEREKTIILARLPPTAPSALNKKVSIQDILPVLKDLNNYIFCLAAVSQFTTAYGIAYFTPRIINLFGFDSTTTQLLTIGPSFVTAVWNIFINWSSDVLEEKGWHSAACLLPPMLGYALFATIQPSLSPWARYGVLFLTATSNGSVSLILGYRTLSLKGASSTALGAATVVMIGNIGGALGGQVYQPTDAPYFVMGHWIQFALTGVALACMMVLKLRIERDPEIHAKKHGSKTIKTAEEIAAELNAQV